MPAGRSRILPSGRGPGETMTSIEISEAHGVRNLHFGSSWVQGAMRIARPWSLELEYTRQMMAPLLAHGPAWPRTVLQVGLGAASLARFLHRHRPRARQCIVEALPGVVAAARQSFKLPAESARLRIVIGDGYEFVAAPSGPFDLLLVDGFDERGQAGMLETLPFYLNCRARLAPGGMAAFNLLDRKRGRAAGLERLREAFEGRIVVLPRCAAGNTVVLAAGSAPLRLEAKAWRAAALELKAQAGLDLRLLVDGLFAGRAAGEAIEL